MAAVDAGTGSMSSHSLTSLVSSYGILPTLASWMSTRDLYQLALTNRSHHSYILASRYIFRSLRHQCPCDGRGLSPRKTFSGIYRSRPRGGSCLTAWMYGGEEMEMYLYNVKCDQAGALPCNKCDINICEECRCYPRAAPPVGYPDRFPHLDAAYSLVKVMCLCPPCDTEMEKQLEEKFLNDRCDCDRYKRWICSPCVKEEQKFTCEYHDRHTQLEWYPVDDEVPSQTAHDYQFERTAGSLLRTCLQYELLINLFP